MFRYLFFIVAISLSFNLFAQDGLIIGVHGINPVWQSCNCDSLSQDEKEMCTQREIFNWLSKNIVIPPHTKNVGLTNTKVIVQYVVSKTGKVENVKIIKSVHPMIDKQVKDAIENMPNFFPGRLLGENIDTPVSLPIRIELK